MLINHLEQRAYGAQPEVVRIDPISSTIIQYPTPKTPPRPPFDVSNCFATIPDWKTAQIAICDLWTLCHHQADRAQEFSRSYQTKQSEPSSPDQEAKEPLPSSPDRKSQKITSISPKQDLKEAASSSQLPFAKEHLDAYSAETRGLGNLWEEHWEEEMHKRRMVLFAERARREGRGSELQLVDEVFEEFAVLML